MSFKSVSAAIIPTGFGTADIILKNGAMNIPDIEDKNSASVKITYANDKPLNDWPSANDGYIKVNSIDVTDSGDYVFHVGPNIVDPAALGNQDNLKLRVLDFNTPMLLPVTAEVQGFEFLTPSGSRANTGEEINPSVDVNIEPSDGGNAPSPSSNLNTQSNSSNTSAPKAGGKGKLIGLIAGGITSLLLIAAAAFYFLSQNDDGKGGQTDTNVKENVQKEDTENTKPTEDETPVAESEAQNAPENKKDAEDSAPANTEEQPVVETPDAKNESTTIVETPVQSTTTETVTTSAASQDAPAGGNACALTQDSDAIIIKNCLSSGADDATLQKLVKEAENVKRCQLMKRIIIGKGRVSLPFSSMYASLLDPNSGDSSPCIAKDKEQAVYWYDKAISLGGDESLKQKKEALK